MTSPTSSASRETILVRRGLSLAYLTLAYNIVEAGIALASGVMAGSIALVGFGLDSLLEVFAGGVLVWRLWHPTAEKAERRASFLISLTFFLLAIYIVVEAGSALLGRHHPEESILGIGLAVVSLMVMPVLSWLKLGVASRLQSRAMRSEAMETLVCTYLSFALLLGLGLNAWLGWWWADPVAALAMVPFVLKEGIEGVKQEEDE